MCGIIGRVGRDNAVPYLLEGLKRLEYRGYDSAGIAVMRTGEIACRRALGRLSNLCESVQPEQDAGTVGIGHTRWATHGAPSVKNAHPHVSPNGKFAVVHNGIIENADALKVSELSGSTFASETDTEVVAHLLEKYDCGDVVKTLAAVERLLCGSYALGVLCTDFPDTLFCAAKASPLIAAVEEDGSFIASDVSAVVGYATVYYPVANGEIAAITGQTVSFFDETGAPVSKKPQMIRADALLDGKQGYEHYMMLEMMQQPDAVRNTLSPLISGGRVTLGDLSLGEDFLKTDLREIVIVACGSAYHTGLAGRRLFESLCRVPCRAEIASEFRYADPLIDQHTLAVFISQSGETADTLAALRLSRQKGARVLSIVNVAGSAIANESDNVIYTHAGREIAVATTKAYSAQLAVLYALALYLAELRAALSAERLDDLTRQLMALPEKISETISATRAQAEALAAGFTHTEDIYFIGRQLDYAVATEGSLKCKEISYIHSEAYAAGELKHGTISLIEPGTLVIALCTHAPLREKMVSNIREVKARGAVVIAITDENDTSVPAVADHVITLPSSAPLVLPSLPLIPLQLFAYYVALLKGCDIDKPRNLAKSVTVE